MRPRHQHTHTPALWAGLMPMPSLVMMAEVSAGTRNCKIMNKMRISEFMRTKEESFRISGRRKGEKNGRNLEGMHKKRWKGLTSGK